MLNKPKGYLVTAKDDFSRKTVFELLPDFGVRLFSIGRLDYQTEGLLLLTNDGDFANKIIHPKYKLPKVYIVFFKPCISNNLSICSGWMAIFFLSAIVLDNCSKLEPGLWINSTKTKTDTSAGRGIAGKFFRTRFRR